jgi:broad specificity phosphatase PhoE
MLPVRVHLIRHGESAHNAYRATGPENKDPYLWDCELSELGVRQTRVLNEKIKQLQLVPDIIIVSPLTRAIKTAKNGFEHLSNVCLFRILSFSFHLIL